MKTMQVTVYELGLFPGSFKVVKAQDQTAYLPGDTIKKSDLDALCRNSKWKVHIVSGDKK